MSAGRPNMSEGMLCRIVANWDYTAYTYQILCVCGSQHTLMKDKTRVELKKQLPEMFICPKCQSEMQFGGEWHHLIKDNCNESKTT